MWRRRCVRVDIAHGTRVGGVVAAGGNKKAVTRAGGGGGMRRRLGAGERGFMILQVLAYQLAVRLTHVRMNG